MPGATSSIPISSNDRTRRGVHSTGPPTDSGATRPRLAYAALLVAAFTLSTACGASTEETTRPSAPTTPADSGASGDSDAPVGANSDRYDQGDTGTDTTSDTGSTGSDVAGTTATGDGTGASDGPDLGEVDKDTDPGSQRFPDVIDAEATPGDDGTYRFDVTVSSPYDSPERYADAWRILSPDNDVLGVRELTHDHASEQPFTRSLDGVEVPADVTEVTIEGRDLANGWGGTTLVVSLA